MVTGFKIWRDAEAAPASTEGRNKTHEGCQKGAWLTIFQIRISVGLWITANNTPHVVVSLDCSN